MTRRLLPLLAAALLALPAEPRAQDKADESPAAPAGTWKVTLPWNEGAGDRPLWLVKFEKKADGWSGEVVAVAPRTPKATLEKVSVRKGLLYFTLKMPNAALRCEVALADPKADKLRGSAATRRAQPLELERTSLSSLDSYEVAKEALARLPLGQEVVLQALTLLQQVEAKKPKPAEVRGWAEKAIKAAGLYGPGWQRDILLAVA